MFRKRLRLTLSATSVLPGASCRTLRSFFAIDSSKKISLSSSYALASVQRTEPPHKLYSLVSRSNETPGKSGSAASSSSRLHGGMMSLLAPSFKKACMIRWQRLDILLITILDLVCKQGRALRGGGARQSFSPTAWRASVSRFQFSGPAQAQEAARLLDSR